MIIAGEKYKVLNIFDTFSTVPDCIVKGPNKIGGGHGESKFYIANKDVMRNFYGGEGFEAKCIMLRTDLLSYMAAIKTEYENPSYPYGCEYNKGRKKITPWNLLWKQRTEYIESLDEVIEFTIKDQNQIAGPRGYVNSSDSGYQVFREIALPLCSYISAYQLETKNGSALYYWKLFVDFDALENRGIDPHVFTYGKAKGNAAIEIAEKKEPEQKNKESISQARVGQGEYREKLLDECPFCPITRINDERLLIASHIKPWAVSSDAEKIDPKNGYMLSPMFDKLFDRGFMTFTEDRRVHLSTMISPKNFERIGLKNNDFIQALPMDEKRIQYLNFHHNSVFKGILE